MQKSENDNDIIFDDSPLDASEGWRSIHKRAIDNLDDDDDDDSHWLWSNVNRIKRSIHDMLQTPETQIRAKRDWWNAWLEEPNYTEKETIIAKYTTEYTTEMGEETEEQNDHSNEFEPINEAEDDELDNEIDGSGTQELAFTNDGKLERFCKFAYVLFEQQLK